LHRKIVNLRIGLMDDRRPGIQLAGEGDLRAQMRALRFITVALLFAVARIVLAAEELPAKGPETVIVPSGTLRLKAFLWTPPGFGPFPVVLFNHGAASTDPAHTARFAITEAAEKLGPTFAKHGYAFLYLFRRGQGLSADQGAFMRDILGREKHTKGEEARNHVQFVLLTTDHLADVIAALSSLKSLPAVDAQRIATMGHSSGGILSVLAAGRDNTLRATVTFAAAARSWDSSPEIRESMLSAVRKTTVPLMLLHASNDFSVVPGQAMADELASVGKPHLLKIYPAIGKTHGDGHNFMYTAIDQWKDDVFRFLDEHVR
jgi:carboxymethylenebutenolidase